MTVNWEDYDSGIPPFDPGAVRALETEMGVTFPHDYVAAVRDHAGQTTDKETIDVGQGSSSFGALFFISGDPQHVDHYDSVRKAIADIRGWKGDSEYDKLLPFASNTASDYFCLDFRNAPTEPGVVMLDLSLGPDHSRSLLPVAGSFGDFLSKLH